MKYMVKKLDYTLESLQILMDYISEVNNDFGIPISQKVPIATFSEKLLRHGNVYAVFEGKKVAALIGFYCNDEINGTAHLPFLSTQAWARRKGYAHLLIQKMIEVCRLNNMKIILCDSVNPYAISLYQLFGFTIYDEIIESDFLKTYLKLELNN